MSDSDFAEVQQQFIGSIFGEGTYGAGIYGGAQILYGDMEYPQSTSWQEINE